MEETACKKRTSLFVSKSCVRVLNCGYWLLRDMLNVPFLGRFRGLLEGVSALPQVFNEVPSVVAVESTAA